MIRRLLAKIVISGAALWAADYLLAGFSVGGGIKGYIIAGVVLGLLNALVRPLVRLVTLPLIIVTLGLFTVVINAAILIAAAQLTHLITYDGPLTLIYATLILSVVHMVLDPRAHN